MQDVGFVLAALYCAHLGGRVVRSWQFGLRRPGAGWRRATGMIGLLLVAFLVLSIAWSAIFHPEEETLLKSLGSNEGTGLLLLSAALTCVIAPICEEFLFRGFIFTALRSWRGTLPAALLTGLLFGGVHVGSAPALDLVPLAGLGFGLCLLYRYSGSLYPCIVAAFAQQLGRVREPRELGLAGARARRRLAAGDRCAGAAVQAHRLDRGAEESGARRANKIAVCANSCS